VLILAIESNIWLKPRISLGLVYELSVAVRYNVTVTTLVHFAARYPNSIGVDGGGMVLILLAYYDHRRPCAMAFDPLGAIYIRQTMEVSKTKNND